MARKRRLKLSFYTDGKNIWFYTGKTYKSKSYSVPDNIIEEVARYAQNALRVIIKDLLGISK
jgi:hypothetical protein